MNEIQVFNNPDFGSIRCLEINNEPWMVLTDVCKVLELTTPSRVASRLEEDEVSQTHIIDTIGRQQEMTIINESGLYSVILRSDKPKAKPFRKWVTGEVLPTIRKHGAYMTQDTLEKALLSPDFLIQLGVKLKEEQEKREQLEFVVANQNRMIEDQERDIQRMKPKEQFADAVADSQDTILIRDLAKILKQNGVKTGEKRLYAWLRDNGYIMKNSTLPTQRAMNQGLFIVKESVQMLPDGSRIRQTTKVTGKGQRFFIDKGLKLKTMDGVR